GLISIIIVTNLIIGFATSSLSLDGKANKGSCSCWRNSTTNCLVRFVFILNQLVFFAILFVLVLCCIFCSLLYLLATLCNDDARANSEPLLNHGRSFEPSHQNSINLMPFHQLLFFGSNETQLLLFKDNRLKTLCRDYVSTLMLYNLISLLGIFILF